MAGRALRVLLASTLAIFVQSIEYRGRHAGTKQPAWVTDGCNANEDFLQAVVARNVEPWLSARSRFTKEFMRSRIDEMMMPTDGELRKAKNYTGQIPLEGLSDINQQIVPFLIHKGAIYLYAPLRHTNR